MIIVTALQIVPGAGVGLIHVLSSHFFSNFFAESLM